jgi:hypothetical protein
MPWWFIIILLLFIMSLISNCIRRLPKSRNKVISLSKDKIDKLMYSYVKLIKICKIMFVMIPVYLFILPYLLYRYLYSQEFIYRTAMLILMYIMLLDIFILQKSIIKEIQDREAKEEHSISQPI